MKHLKTFEKLDPFGDEEEAWWNEPKIKKDGFIEGIYEFRVIKVGGNYFLSDMIMDGKALLFYMHRGVDVNLSYVDLNPKYDENTIIFIYDEKNEYHNDDGTLWAKFKYKDIPEKILNFYK